MGKSIGKMTIRSIRSFFGRYMALLLIVALSVGFFSGLKVTKQAMGNTGEKYLEEQQMYDFRIFSTLGFSEEDVEQFASLSMTETAEGMKTMDMLMELENGDVAACKLMELPEQINQPSLVAGRMPTAENECVADDEVFSEDSIGTVIRLADEESNEEELLEVAEYTIVGLVDSPLYLNGDRGTTSIGNGSLLSFIYLPQGSFAQEVYTEVCLTLTEKAPIYSDEYESLIEEKEDTVTEEAKRIAEERYDTLLEEAGVPEEMAELAGLTRPEVYVLTRAENTGYNSFENDTSIVSGIANIFPLFFIMIAMLVCITTMSRMVDEERTQIGVLKALGFSERAITGKYLLYAGSATLLGWVLGFFLGTWGIPQIFWFAYNAIYDFAPMTYLFSEQLAVLTLAVSMAGILGSTWLSCRRELGSEPAKLIRPRAPKNGRKVLLEHVTFFWNRLTFLQKVTLRNMFRYKRRLIMMLFGISCCAALVVTGFGVRDSMVDLGDLQFEGVQQYDIEVSFAVGEEEEAVMQIEELDGVDEILTGAVSRVDLHSEKTMKSVRLLSFQTEELEGFWDFHMEEEQVALPQTGEAIISSKIARRLELEIGDTVEIEDADLHTFSVTVSGIFENYVDNFIVISYEDAIEEWEDWGINTVFLSTDQSPSDMAQKLVELEHVTGVSRLETSRETVESALSCLDYIIWMVVLFSGALAFIVIYNLTNINLAERSREIATVQVLGFYPKETESYVLRENLIMAVLASAIGMPLGTAFHYVVMNMIVVDIMTFPVYINGISYLEAIICTVLFAVVVNVVMKRRINKIHMAESLKAVE